MDIQFAFVKCNLDKVSKLNSLLCFYRLGDGISRLRISKTINKLKKKRRTPAPAVKSEQEVVSGIIEGGCRPSVPAWWQRSGESGWRYRHRRGARDPRHGRGGQAGPCVSDPGAS